MYGDSFIVLYIDYLTKSINIVIASKSPNSYSSVIVNIIIRKAVLPFSNSYYGELKAIALSVEHSVILSTLQYIGDLCIFSDCQSALLALSTSKPSKNYTEFTLQTRRNLQKLEERGTSTIATRVCGHAKIQENCLTDMHAKITATDASFLHSNQVPISLSEGTADIKKR